MAILLGKSQISNFDWAKSCAGKKADTNGAWLLYITPIRDFAFTPMHLCSYLHAPSTVGQPWDPWTSSNLFLKAAEQITIDRAVLIVPLGIDEHVREPRESRTWRGFLTRQCHEWLFGVESPPWTLAFAQHVECDRDLSVWTRKTAEKLILGTMFLCFLDVLTEKSGPEVTRWSRSKGRLRTGIKGF